MDLTKLSSLRTDYKVIHTDSITFAVSAITKAQLDILDGDIKDNDFVKATGFKQSDVLLYGNAKLNLDKLKKDKDFYKDITRFLNAIIPSIKNDITGDVQYPCFTNLKDNRVLLYCHNSVLSSYNCLVGCLDYPDAILIRKLNLNSSDSDSVTNTNANDTL